MIHRQRILKNFGGWVEERLRELGVERAEVEKLCGVKQPTLSRLIAGKNRPQPETLEKLAPVLQASVDELLSKAGYPLIRTAASPPPAADLVNKADMDLLLDPDIRIIARQSKELTATDRRLLIRLIKSMLEEESSS